MSDQPNDALSRFFDGPRKSAAQFAVERQRRAEEDRLLAGTRADAVATLERVTGRRLAQEPIEVAFAALALELERLRARTAALEAALAARGGAGEGE